MSEPRSVKLVAKKAGGHYHTAIFTANNPNQTYAKCGNVVFDEKDIEAFKNNNYTLIFEIHNEAG